MGPSGFYMTSVVSDERWRTTQCVFDPTGEFLGLMHQRRQVEVLSDGRTRITLENLLSEEIGAHAASVLAGSWQLLVAQHGPELRVEGVDATGTGVAMAPSGSMSSMYWPRMLQNFSSMYLNISPWRIALGGLLYRSDTRDASARTFGIGMAEAEVGHAWPLLDCGMRASDFSAHWRGVLRLYGAGGVPLSEQPLHRAYHAEGWVDRGARAVIQQSRQAEGGAWMDAHAIAGRLLTYGGVGASARMVDTHSGVYRAAYIEIFDAGSGSLAWMRRWLSPISEVQYECAVLKLSAH